MEITTLVSLRCLRFPALLLPALSVLPTALHGQSFVADVAPVFARNCVSCHSATQSMAALNLSSAEGLTKGGQNGPAVSPGNPEASRLYRRIAGLEQPAMPLGGKLTEAD